MRHASFSPAGRWQRLELSGLLLSTSERGKEPTSQQTLPPVSDSTHTLSLNPYNALEVGLLSPSTDADVKLRTREEVWLAWALSGGISWEPDARAWRDISSGLQEDPLRWGTLKWVNPSDMAGKEQQESCPAHLSHRVPVLESLMCYLSTSASPSPRRTQCASPAHSL